MLNNFIYAKQKSLFEEKLNNNEVLDEAIAFIEDTKEIWNHGTYFDGSKVDLSNIEESILNILDNYATKKELPTKLSLLTNDANYIQEDVLVNGIYAVTPTNRLVDLEHADTSCVGVAVVMPDIKYVINKHDLNNSLTLYWGKNLKGLDVPGIENLGLYNFDFTGGKNNTNALISSYTTLGVEMDSRDVSKSLQTFYESGDTDWYIPSNGLLVYMYSNFAKINEILSKIGGTLLVTTTDYWSSNESSTDDAISALLKDGNVLYPIPKDSLCRVRLIKDLSEQKLVKERIDDLETEVYELGINTGNIPVVNHGTSDTTFELTPNVFHKWDTVSELTLTLAEADENIYNEYMFLFTSGDTATTFSVPDTILWVIQPNILNNRTYQCSILNNIGVFVTV